MSEAERISGCPPACCPKSLTEKPAKIRRTFRANFSNWVSLSSAPPAIANRKRMQTYPSQHFSFQPRPPGMIILTFIFSFIPYQKKSVKLDRITLFLILFTTLGQDSIFCPSINLSVSTGTPWPMIYSFFFLNFAPVCCSEGKFSLPCSCWRLWGFDCSNCCYCWKK